MQTINNATTANIPIVCTAINAQILPVKDTFALDVFNNATE